MIFHRIYLYLRMIKLSHSIFALPFAFTSAFLAAQGLPSLRQGFWITVAMVGARSAAMGFNRVIDRRIDAKNPRTRMREIPSGKIGVGEAVVFSVLSLAVLVLAAYMLNPLCFTLSPVAIMILILYSYTKRFTYLSHIVLGIAISAAPVGAWIAVRGTVGAEIVPLAVGVVFWLAGFDVLYALQDVDFDKSKGLHSIPQRFGVNRALMVSRVFHLITWGLLFITGFSFRLGSIYYIGLAIVGVLLIYEHSLIRKDDLSKLNIAFFNMNGYISITVFVMTTVDLLVR